MIFEKSISKKHHGSTIVLVIVIGFILFGCKDNLSKRKLNFSIRNATKYELNNLRIGLYDTILEFNILAKMSDSHSATIKWMYPYNLINFRDKKNRKYHFQPIDNVGEELINKGDFKYVIESLDTLNSTFNFRIEYKE